MLAIAVERPLPAPVTASPTSIRVMVAGDLLPHRPMLLPPERVRDALAPLAPLLSAADVAVANYETATGDPHNFLHDTISLAAPPDWMAEVAHARFGAITVANNHACDLGRAGLQQTLATARDLDLVSLGADTVDPWRAQVIASKDGHRVCAVAWTTFVNARGPACVKSHEIALAPFDKRGLERIERAITRARGEGCEAVIAILHGGREYAPQIWGPRLQARRAAEVGADAVVIHHPHVPSGIDVVTTRDGRRVPVFESVGNLLSNQGESWKMPLFPESREHLISLNAWTRLGVIADLEWTWQGTGTGTARAEHPVLSWGYHLLWTENEHAENRKDPMPRISVRPLDPTGDRALIDRLSSDEQGPKGLLSDACWLESGGPRCQAARTAPSDVGL
jgi:hypothetical protein